MKEKLSPIEEAMQRLDTIERARFMYCELEMSAPTIADELKINVKTVYDWRGRYDWKTERTCSLVFNTKQVIAFLADINKVEDTELIFSLLSNLMKGQKL